MLYRLVSWTILTIPHSVVRKDKNRWQLHQSRQPDRRARVITENKEACAEGPEFRQRKSIHNSGHSMLANTEMQVPPT